MLTDHRVQQERWARGNRERRTQGLAWGRYIASLAGWNWFINPLTFRDTGFRVERAKTGEMGRRGNVVICPPDPRLVSYKPSSRYAVDPGPPKSEVAIAQVKGWLAEIEKIAQAPVGWIIAEELGRETGRLHCHILVTGVSRLSRNEYARAASRRFGYTKILTFDKEQAGSFYAAKYEGRSQGGIHLGGTLRSVDLSRCLESHSNGGGRDVMLSDAAPRCLYHTSLPRRHR